MLSAICFNLDQSEILLSGNGLNAVAQMTEFVLTQAASFPKYIVLKPSQIERRCRRQLKCGY